MDKNSLIQEIKNDLNSIKKQVEVTLAKLEVLEALYKLDVVKVGTLDSSVHDSESQAVELGISSEDVLLNVSENLEVKDKTAHREEHFKKVTTIEHCYICKKEIVVDSRRRANHYRSKNKNPDKWFCSKHCSGIFGQKEQQNRKLSD